MSEILYFWNETIANKHGANYARILSQEVGEMPAAWFDQVHKHFGRADYRPTSRTVKRIVVGAFSSDEEIAERALLCAWYALSCYPRKVSQPALLALSEDALNDSRSKVRGRKIWIRVKTLNAPDNVEFLNKAIKKGLDDYGQERAVAALESLKTTPVLLDHLVPLVRTWPDTVRNCAYGLVADSYFQALKYQSLVSRVLLSHVDIRDTRDVVPDLYRIHGTLGREYPIAFERFKDDFSADDREKRLLRLHHLQAYLYGDYGIDNYHIHRLLEGEYRADLSIVSAHIKWLIDFAISGDDPILRFQLLELATGVAARRTLLLEIAGLLKRVIQDPLPNREDTFYRYGLAKALKATTANLCAHSAGNLIDLPAFTDLVCQREPLLSHAAAESLYCAATVVDGFPQSVIKDLESTFDTVSGETELNVDSKPRCLAITDHTKLQEFGGLEIHAEGGNLFENPVVGINFVSAMLESKVEPLVAAILEKLRKKTTLISKGGGRQ